MAATKEDLLIEQGADFSKTFEIKNPDGSDYDLTGASAVAQIRKTYSDKSVIASFDIAIDGTLGKIQMTLPAADTALIPVSKATSFKKVITSYAWDIFLTLSDGRVFRLFEGAANISPEVTR